MEEFWLKQFCYLMKTQKFESLRHLYEAASFISMQHYLKLDKQGNKQNFMTRNDHFELKTKILIIKPPKQET